ncbi:hypothetical protein M595_0869 [Lyngbya aestuarii BL J]|uniref:Uncharacterized protein n=1 Tax=Lyngbya aestuarii BL J TaxID=1348334 RepID=U7QP95_9CYAN|nr:hypothetical protein [Lyngbya aestuarii]ERT09097.1 hypothetical protein M595_0869 [Lyngbya aestuarii BL J]
MYEISDPPYVILVVGLFAGITSCTAFITTLKQLLKEWSSSRSTRVLANLRGFQLLLPYSGITVGICLFLASCLQVFTFSAMFSYSFSIPLTVLMAGLVWYQLTRLLIQLEQKGTKGIDLDDLSLGKMIPQKD